MSKYIDNLYNSVENKNISENIKEFIRSEINRVNLEIQIDDLKLNIIPIESNINKNIAIDGSDLYEKKYIDSLIDNFNSACFHVIIEKTIMG